MKTYNWQPGKKEKRNKEILALFYKGLKQSSIARIHGITRARVGQIINNSKAKLERLDK